MAKDKDLDMLALLEKAAESMDDPDTATTDELLSAFFGGLETVIGEQIVHKGTGPFTKARLTSMNDVLDTVNKMSDADLAQWLRVYIPTPTKIYDGSKAQVFDAKSHPASENPNANYAASNTPAKDLGDDWNPTGSGDLPGSSTGKELRGKSEFAGAVPSSSSSPMPGLVKSMGALLDSLAGATPAEIERAKSGLSQLDPGIVETLDKAVGAGKLIQSLDAEIDDGTEAVLRRGELLSERELRKSIIVNSANLLERVARIRDASLAKRLEIVGDDEDDFEMQALQGRVR